MVADENGAPQSRSQSKLISFRIVLSGLAVAALEPTRGPGFTAAAGLLIYPQFAYLEYCEPRKARVLATGTDGYFGRVGRWLRDGFRGACA